MGECAVADTACYDVYDNSENSEFAFKMRAENTRCGNIDSGAGLGDLTVTADASDCGALCIGTGGCVGFSYKRGNSYVFWNIAQGACQLRRDNCQDLVDNDWDDYDVGQKVPESFTLNGHYGCSNWKSIRILKSEGESDPGSCAARCQMKSGCVGFGFARRDGACFLWSGACIPEESTDWDDYSVPP
jgi:hypothetical protein